MEGEQSVEACKQHCNNNVECVAIDWLPPKKGGFLGMGGSKSQCILHAASEFTKDVGGPQGYKFHDGRLLGPFGGADDIAQADGTHNVYCFKKKVPVRPMPIVDPTALRA